MNALLCIGCNKYTILNNLMGAEKDALDVYNLLLNGSKEYTNDFSQLLFSPSELEIRNSLKKTFLISEQIDVLTFFFAGHAGVKMGSFYLCSSDSDPNRLSTTAFPIIDLFAMVNEFHPKQVNIIVDACQSGGASFDLNQLLKPEIVGSSDATSITFLGACSADQLAGETHAGGSMTRELIKCLNGEQVVQTKGPFLDLIEIGGVISREVQKTVSKQKPITWGLNFFGNGKFSRNPCFSPDSFEPNFPVGDELERTQAGRRIQLNSSALWNESRAIKETFDPRRLLNLFENVFSNYQSNRADAIPFIRVLANTFSAKAQESPDTLAFSQCLGTCALFLLPQLQSLDARMYVQDVLGELIKKDSEIWQDMLKEIGNDSLSLCNKMEPFAELYYLPLRITKILGWIGLGTIIGNLLPELADENDCIRFDLATKIIENYELSFVAISEAQSPFLYVFLKACLLKGKIELAEKVAHLYFNSLAEKNGNITRVATEGATAFTYMRAFGPAQYHPHNWRPANPSSLLAVLLLFGEKLGFNSIWSLRAFDRKFSNFFIPKDYQCFGDKVIEQGMNCTSQIGFGVWSLSDFKKEFDRTMAVNFPSNAIPLPKEAVALCTVASLLFPDRLPLLLEQMT